MILAWMEENIQNHPVALKWWSLRGQDWTYYQMELCAGCAPDGLEFWAASRASGFHLNLVQRGQIWSSRVAGIDYDDFTLMILEDGYVYCDQVNIGWIHEQSYHERTDKRNKLLQLQPLDLSFSRDELW